MLSAENFNKSDNLVPYRCHPLCVVGLCLPGLDCKLNVPGDGESRHRSIALRNLSYASINKDKLDRTKIYFLRSFVFILNRLVLLKRRFLHAGSIRF
jgi:hypothetical protein